MASLLLVGAPLHAQLRLPALFGDGMVLQRETTAPVWGWAEAHAPVRVRGSWMPAALETRADGEGRWRVELPTPAAGGPHQLVVRASTEIVLEDVLVGEVWIASGQSNMEWPLSVTDDAQAAVAAADHPRMRFFDVPNVVSVEPAQDCGGVWRACEPASSAGFSAVAYYFGRELLEELDVPVGLIGTNWGGTPVVAWTSERTLRRRGDFESQLEHIARTSAAQARDPLEVRQDAWWGRHEAEDPGMVEGWMDPAADDSDWATAGLPGGWSSTGSGEHDGCVWYRRTVEVPQEWVGAELVLELGAIDDMDLVWFDGGLVGETRGDGHARAPRRYRVAAGSFSAGRALIAVCVVDAGGEGGFVGEAGEMRLYPNGVPEGALELAGAWKYRVGGSLEELGAWPRADWFNSSSPTALFNGMIAPLVPYAMRGAIWYQGESDVGRAGLYRSLFPEMIRDWRGHWGQGDFPFLFVQIAPFEYGAEPGQVALLREAQTLALATPATGMAVTMDIGDPKDIHPRNKLEVGRRLALWALARTYGRDGLEHSGPLYRSMQVEGELVRLNFDHAAGLSSADAPPSHLTIAGADRVFHPARARIDGDTLLVWSPAVPTPLAVRYAWGEADRPNLVNAAGLPAPSFRTDTWD